MIRVADLEHRCVAVCCSVLQCVAVCCSVLQCVAVYCSVLGKSMIRVADLEHRFVAVCYSALQCVVREYSQGGGLAAQMCTGCQKVLCILLHFILCRFSHPAHLRAHEKKIDLLKMQFAAEFTVYNHCRADF